MPAYATIDEAWAHHAQYQPLSINPDDCPICRDPYNTDHRPVLIITSNSCKHVFGDQCLRAWLESNNANALTCPACRCAWFPGEDPWEDESFFEADSNNENEEDTDSGPEDDAADDEDFEDNQETTADHTFRLEDVRSRETANVFIDTLFYELRVCESDANEADIKACVEHACLEADLQESVPLADELWSQIRRTIRRMLRDSKTTEWDDDTEHNWIRRMRRILHWELD